MELGRWLSSVVIFQSTLSVRRATLDALNTVETQYISIHALRKESDLHQCSQSIWGMLFQSTLSVRRATQLFAHVQRHGIISIHALRKESDRLRHVRFQSAVISIHALRKESDLYYSYVDKWFHVFQSTLSVRRATGPDRPCARTSRFQSTLSVRRATVQLDIFVHFLRRKPAAWL